MPLRCTLPNAQHSRVPGGPASDGKFASEALSRYSERMNQLIAEAIVECVASGKSEPGGPVPSRAALGHAPPANAAKPAAPSDPAASPAPTLADRELQIFHDAGYTIKLHPPDYFLGCNVTPGESHSKLGISMKAYVTQLASKYLPRALDTYPMYTPPSTKALFAAYETALRREHAPWAQCSSQPLGGRQLGSFLHARMHSGAALIEVDVFVLTHFEMLIQRPVVPHGRVVLTPGSRKR